ncbi:taurine ABC transporter permease [Candidatus Epulonipiscium fishelsonii]|uniref:Taurine ABC transporter permease n=1 Tax=Candidatus Epulonipiscium fishelsonii TaxID=77094 RepID=A0ACC8XJE8_9FIRM|nr:taurine ABC transporter permease [Epulopiscium sp. SCG-D08WGA-EpuloA1]OON95121.1 MAG: taurine ABC transporter permease [Epulopiscium sp. AS2M-Bin002]
MKKQNNLLITILPVISILMLIGIWLFASSQNSELVPTPLKVWDRLLLLFEKPVSGYNLFGHIFVSLRRVIIALIFSTIIGILMGIAIGWSRVASKTIGVLFELIRPIPPIAWISIIVMWFGIGEMSKIVMVFIGTLMPIVINTYTGIKMVDHSLIDVADTFQATEKQLLMEIAIPSALPSIMAGIRNAIGVGWMVVLAAEMIGAKEGVGFLITRGSEFFDIPLIMVGMIAIGVVGALLSAGVELLERKMCPWAYRME